MEGMYNLCAEKEAQTIDLWQAGEMSRRYEAEGGDYKDTGDNKNKAQKVSDCCRAGQMQAKLT